MSCTLAAIVATCLLAALRIGAAAETPVELSPRGDSSIQLEGLLDVPPEASAPIPAVVLCHPDPRHGGSMDSYVVAALQEACRRSGWATLRFNFRGVDRSGGTFDDGNGEVLDCLGALDRLRATPGVAAARVAVVGYSFGSWVGLRAVVADGRVRACTCVAFPVPAGEDIGKHGYLARVGCPVLFVTGTADSISSLSTVQALVAACGCADRCRVVPLEGVDHFYGHPADLRAVAKATVEFLRPLLAP